MKKHFPMWVPVALIIFIFFANLIAEYWHLYYLIWWLDIPMHLLGGFSIAISALVLYYLSWRGKSKEHSGIFVLTLSVSAALTLGLVWEFHEYILDKIFVANGDQVGDTLKDLFDDLSGGLLAAWVFLRGGYHDVP